jgi:hypothetical protein
MKILSRILYWTGILSLIFSTILSSLPILILSLLLFVGFFAIYILFLRNSLSEQEKEYLRQNPPSGGEGVG